MIANVCAPWCLLTCAMLLHFVNSGCIMNLPTSGAGLCRVAHRLCIRTFMAADADNVQLLHYDKFRFDPRNSSAHAENPPTRSVIKNFSIKISACPTKLFNITSLWIFKVRISLMSFCLFFTSLACYLGWYVRCGELSVC